MTTYFTFANLQTPAGAERLSIILKLFRPYIKRGTLEELNLTSAFYKTYVEEKPKARYIVFSIDNEGRVGQKNDFGFGVFTEQEVERGKKISKEVGDSHDYARIDEFIILLVSYLTLRYGNGIDELQKPGLATNAVERQ